MPNSKEELLSIFTAVLSMEKGSREFYLKAEERIIDKKGKEMFKRLASLEDGHMRYLQHLYSSMQGGKKMLSLAEFKEKNPAEIMEGGIKVDDALAETDNPAFIDDLDALKIAKDKEHRTYSFYQKLIRKSQDTNAKFIFEELAKAEKKHIKYLEELREKLS